MTAWNKRNESYRDPISLDRSESQPRLATLHEEFFLTSHRQEHLHIAFFLMS